MSVDSNMQDFGQRFAAAWCSQDPSRVADFFTKNGSLTINDGVPAIGRPAITESARSFMTAFPDMQVLLDGLVVQSEIVEFHWTLIGTNNGPGGSGNRVCISGFEQWQFDQDGLIAISQGHFNNAKYNRQLLAGVQQEH